MGKPWPDHCPAGEQIGGAISAAGEGGSVVRKRLNDGLALPIVVAMIALVGHEGLHVSRLAGELALGVALGVVVPWVACHTERSRFFAVAHKDEPIFAFSIGLLLLSLGLLTHGNPYLAAFAAGITITTMRPD